MNRLFIYQKENLIRGLKGLLILLCLSQIVTGYSQTFTYSGSPFCNTDGVSKSPTISGITGVIAKDTFEIIFPPSPSGTLPGFDPDDGSFTPTGSVTGTYLIRAIVTKQGSGMKDTLFTFLVIDSSPTQTPSFTYDPDTVCNSSPSPIPTIMGGPSNGTFKLTGAGVTVDPITGLVDVLTAASGKYEILFIYSGALGGCVDTLRDTVIVISEPSADFTLDPILCSTGTDPTAAFTPTAGATYSFTSSPLASLISTAGVVDLSAGVGSFLITNTATLGGCTVTASKAIYIDTLPDPPPTISYGTGTFCENGPDVTPTITGLGNGNLAFSAPNISVNSQTGQVTLSGKMKGTYTINYTYSSPLGVCSMQDNKMITIVDRPDPSFDYNGDPIFCRAGTNPVANLTVMGNNNFVSSPANIIATSTTGEIDLTKPAGTYVITNTRTANGCSESASLAVTLEESLPQTAVSYSNANFCKSAPDAAPTIQGVQNGTFFALSPGLSIDANSGVIDLSQSQSRTSSPYQVFYAYQSPLGACRDTVMTSVGVLNAPDPSFSYTSNIFCTNGTDPQPVSGTLDVISYTPNDPGDTLTINTSTGVIDLSKSSIGSFIITNTITSNGCVASANVSITISDTTQSTFTYPGSPYCDSETNPRAMISGTPGGGFRGLGTGSNLVFVDTVTGEVNLTASTPGLYTVIYESPGTGGCGSTFSSTIEILGSPPEPAVTLSDNNICLGEALPTLTNLKNGLTWYSSTNPIVEITPNPVNATNLGFDNSTADTYTVFVRDSSAGCYSTFKELELVVDGRPMVSIQANPSDTFCMGQNLTVIGSSDPNASPASRYQLLLSDTIATTAMQVSNSAFVVPNLKDNDSLSIVGNPGACADTSDYLIVTVEPLPLISFTSPPPFIIGPTSAPISLNSFVSAPPANSSGVFTAPLGVTSSGGAYEFDPSISGINPNGDTIMVTYTVTGPPSRRCVNTVTFAMEIDTNSIVSNALSDINRVALRKAFCQDEDTMTILIDLSSFGNFNVLCNFTIEQAGNPIDTLPQVSLGNSMYSVRFDPKTLTSGQYSFKLNTSGPGVGCTPLGGFIFNIKEVPLTPVVNGPALPSCAGVGNVNDLLTLGNPGSGGVKYLWYTDTTMSPLDSTIGSQVFNSGITTVPPGNQIIYYARAELQGCLSPGFGFDTLTIYPLPNKLMVTPNMPTFCEGNPLPSLTIQNPNATQNPIFKWYDTQDDLLATTSTLNVNPNQFASKDSPRVEFKVIEVTFDQGLFEGCSTLDSATTVIITQTARPNKPTPDPNTPDQFCLGDTLPSINILNSTGKVTWWSDAALTNKIDDGDTISGSSLPIISSQTGSASVFITDSLNGCRSEPISYTFTVNALPIVSFFGLPDSGVLCSDVGDLFLFGRTTSPYNPDSIGVRPFRLWYADSVGVFIDSAISGNKLLTDKLLPGDFFVTYKYTDTVGCSAVDTQTLKVNATPDVMFGISGRCQEDTLVLKDISILDTSAGDSIISRKWQYLNFEDSTEIVEKPNFPASGLINVFLEVTTNNSCSNSLRETIFIGSSAKPDFTWGNICEGDITAFIGRATVLDSREQVQSYIWDFGQGPVMGVRDTIMEDTIRKEIGRGAHVFAPGVYEVSLTVTNINPSLGRMQSCSDTKTQTVYVHPTVEVTSERGYFENFQLPEPDTLNLNPSQLDFGWVAQPQIPGDTSDWQLGRTQRNIFRDPANPDSNNAWITVLDTTYSAGEQSWVVSPCFDLRKVNKPMINLDIWSHTVEGRDGAVLEVSIDSSSDAGWKVLGSFKDGVSSGLNWYNENTISAKPGEQIFGLGWSGEEGQWKNARHKLDEFIGEDRVRFRVSFGSDENHALGQDSVEERKFKGFAFDNFFIGERKQNVLLEHFTNMRKDTTKYDRINVYSLSKRFNNSLDIIPIEYHVRLDGVGDAINQLNEDDPEARAFQYAIPDEGIVAINGNEYVDAAFFDRTTIDSLKNHQNLLDKRALLEPAFTIEIDTAASGVQGTEWVIQATVTAKPPYPDEEDEIFVFFGILERRVTVGNENLQYVLRKLVPDNGGVQFDWVNDDDSSNVFRVAWQLDNQKFNDIDELYSVVFVQGKDFNQVYQAASSNLQGPGRPFFPVQLEDQLHKNGMVVYPNPVKNILYIKMRDKSPGPVSWSIFDLHGKTWGKGYVEPDAENTYFVRLKNLPESIYILQLKDSAGNIFRKKVVKMN